MELGLTTGTVGHYDGTESRFSAGQSDWIDARRDLGITQQRVQADDLDWDALMVQVAYHALRRQGDVAVAFDEWFPTVARLEIGKDPESPAPPG